MGKRIRIVVGLTLCAGWLRANPVMFLHGWNSDSGIWKEMRGLLVSDAGYASGDLRALSYYAADNSDSGCTTSTDIRTVAAFVAREFETFYVERGATQAVDLVCHSMGGLVARSMIAQDLIDPSHLRRFVTLATPHYGQNAETSFQAQQMKYGSLFLWELAEAWHFNWKMDRETLCVAGIADKKNGSFWDELVHCWSAALADHPCRYVERSHSGGGLSSIWFTKPVIYGCEDGASDPVYRLVKAFLQTGQVLDQSAMGYTPPSAVAKTGGFFYQIVRADRTPIAYASSKSKLVTAFTREDTAATVSPDYYEHGYNNESQNSGVEFIFGTMPVASYTLGVSKSASTDAFSVTNVPVRPGRVTVARLRADGRAQTTPPTLSVLMVR